MDSPACAGRVFVVVENGELFPMTRWLRQAGFQVGSVPTAKAAVDILALEPPDAIVLDVVMGDWATSKHALPSKPSLSMPGRKWRPRRPYPRPCMRVRPGDRTS
jgi:hypothetical protein